MAETVLCLAVACCLGWVFVMKAEIKDLQEKVEILKKKIMRLGGEAFLGVEVSRQKWNAKKE